MLRKSILLTISIVVLLSFMGCGYKRKAQSKLADKITQGILSKVAGDDVDIDLDTEGGSVKVKVGGEDSISFGTTEWPKGQAAELIPQFDKGKIVYVMNTNEMAMIMVEGVELKDFEKYYQTVQGLGYTENSGQMSSEGSQSYWANQEDGKSNVSLTYTPEEKSFMITVTAQNSDSD